MERGIVVSLVLLWIVLLFNLLVTLALVRRLNTESRTQSGINDGLKPGRPAPTFTAETLGGESVGLADYAGRAVAFLFISPGCQPCREILPSLENLHPLAQRAGVELVLVSVAEATATQAFVDEIATRLPILVAPHEQNPFMADYKITGTPSYSLIDAQGIVRSSGYPSPEWGEWKTLAELWATNTAPEASLTLSQGR